MGSENSAKNRLELKIDWNFCLCSYTIISSASVKIDNFQLFLTSRLSIHVRCDNVGGTDRELFLHSRCCFCTRASGFLSLWSVTVKRGVRWFIRWISLRFCLDSHSACDLMFQAWNILWILFSEYFEGGGCGEDVVCGLMQSLRNLWNY